MPFRHANAYGGYDYPAFPSPGGFDFINYDAVSDPLMSPYDAFSLTTPPDVAWTPISQQPESQHSDSLSPLDLSFATRNSASPGDEIHQGTLATQQLSLDDVAAAPSSAATSLQNGPSLTRGSIPQQTFSRPAESRTFPYKNSQLRESQSHAVPRANAAPPLLELSDKGSSPPAVAPTRRSSTDSNSEASDAGRNKAERPDAPRTRTTDSAKVRHNIVERRYRENINAQVDVLRDSIVATMQVKDEQNGTSSSRLGADELKRLTKAAVIAAATQQIKRARSENDKLLDEHRLLQAQIQDLEKMVKCGDCPLMQLSVDMGLESPS